VFKRQHVVAVLYKKTGMSYTMSLHINSVAGTTKFVTGACEAKSAVHARDNAVLGSR